MLKVKKKLAMQLVNKSYNSLIKLASRGTMYQLLKLFWHE